MWNYPAVVEMEVPGLVAVEEAAAATMVVSVWPVVAAKVESRPVGRGPVVVVAPRLCWPYVLQWG